MKSVPPRLAEWVLMRFLREDLAEEVLGDLDEKFYATLESKTLLRAKLDYWFQVINYLRPFAFKNATLFHPISKGMYKNYLKIGYRNLLRNKGYSSINILGLAVGMSVAMLIGLWVQDELSFGEYHENHARVAQVMEREALNGNISIGQALPIPLRAELLSKYGEDFESVILAFWRQSLIISYDDINLTAEGNFMGSDVIDMFTLKMLKGGSNALTEPGSIIISESLAKIIFKESDPIGQLMKIDNELNVMVTGVYEDAPKNSDFYGLSWIAPWKLWETSQEWVRHSANTHDWSNNSFQIYVSIAEYVNMTAVSERIKQAKFNNVNERAQALTPELFLHPMDDWHLRSAWENGVQKGGLIQFVVLFGIIGVLVLILGCINFMNLSTAQSERRSKEVGIRKAIGAQRGQLMSQFLTESFLVVMLSFVLAMIIISLVMPLFNGLVEKDLFVPFSDVYFWCVSLGFILVTALLAGSYPALYLSSFRPIAVLKGTFRAAGSALLFRKVLVVFQFTTSVALVIGTIIVQQQIEHTKDRPMGYEVDGTIMTWSNSAGFKGKFDVLRNELKSTGAIVEMSESSSPITMVFSRVSSLSWEGKHPDYTPNFGRITVTPEYGQTVGWEITKGRDFSRNFATDTAALIINQKAANEMGMDDPIGKMIKWGNDEHARHFQIIGVINNMLVESPFDEISPMIFAMSKSDMNCMTLKLHPNKSASASLMIIQDVFNKHIPSVPFDYRFTDQAHGKKFASVEKVGKLSGIFAALAIIISCLGIFGMASFVAEQRTKEIGIRKVLGSSVFDIWKMLASGFVLLVGVSFLIAIPIAFFTLSAWLEGFDYKKEIHWSVFAIAGLGALLITMMTVSYHAIHSALGNPLNSLRSE
ncbi:MAG: putative ABC transport system permease protein [Cyclobacteriaceae bacterium]